MSTIIRLISHYINKYRRDGDNTVIKLTNSVRICRLNKKINANPSHSNKVQHDSQSF